MFPDLYHFGAKIYEREKPPFNIPALRHIVEEAYQASLMQSAYTSSIESGSKKQAEDWVVDSVLATHKWDDDWDFKAQVGNPVNLNGPDIWSRSADKICSLGSSWQQQNSEQMLEQPPEIRMQHAAEVFDLIFSEMQTEHLLNTNEEAFFLETFARANQYDSTGYSGNIAKMSLLRLAATGLAQTTLQMVSNESLTGATPQERYEQLVGVVRGLTLDMLGPATQSDAELSALIEETQKVENTEALMAQASGSQEFFALGLLPFLKEKYTPAEIHHIVSATQGLNMLLGSLIYFDKSIAARKLEDKFEFPIDQMVEANLEGFERMIRSSGELLLQNQLANQGNKLFNGFINMSRKTFKLLSHSKAPHSLAKTVQARPAVGKIMIANSNDFVLNNQ